MDTVGMFAAIALELWPRLDELGRLLGRTAGRTAKIARSVVLTAFRTPEVEQESYDRGAHVFLHKPQAMAEIAAVAATLLEGI